MELNETNMKSVTALLNKIKVELGSEFYKEDFIKKCGEVKFPMSKQFVLRFLLKAGIVTKGKKTFRFVNPLSPIHWSAVKEAFELYREYWRGRSKEKPKTVTKVTVEEAIKILQETGEYRILRKKVEWEEI